MNSINPNTKHQEERIRQNGQPNYKDIKVKVQKHFAKWIHALKRTHSVVVLSFQKWFLSVFWCVIILSGWVLLQKITHHSARPPSGQKGKWCWSKIEWKKVIMWDICHQFLYGTKWLSSYYVLYFLLWGQMNCHEKANCCWLKWTVAMWEKSFQTILSIQSVKTLISWPDH